MTNVSQLNPVIRSGIAAAMRTGAQRLQMPSTCPFDGEFPLHLGETSHDVKEEAVREGTGVDHVGETLELHALLVKLADQVHQILDAAAEPIEFPDDQGVTLA